MSELMPGVDVARRRAWLESNPAGRSIIMIGFDADTGELAGMTAMFPRRIQDGGRVVNGTLGGDGWVRPRFRRRGLASTMHLACRFALDADGYELMFGTPLPANSSPLASAGMHTLGEVVRYACPFSGLIGWRRRAPALEPAAPHDPRLDEAWRAARSELGIATVRDAAFYEWRYRTAPAGRQRAFVVLDGTRVAGACALERCGSRLRIVDLVCVKADLPRVLQAVRDSDPEADGFEIRMTRSNARRLGLWRFGFIPRETLPFSVMLSQKAERATQFLDAEAWHFSDADTDLDRTTGRATPELPSKKQRATDARPTM